MTDAKLKRRGFRDLSGGQSERANDSPEGWRNAPKWGDFGSGRTQRTADSRNPAACQRGWVT